MVTVTNTDVITVAAVITHEAATVITNVRLLLLKQLSSEWTTLLPGRNLPAPVPDTRTP